MESLPFEVIDSPIALDELFKGGDTTDTSKTEDLNKDKSLTIPDKKDGTYIDLTKHFEDDTKNADGTKKDADALGKDKIEADKKAEADATQDKDKKEGEGEDLGTFGILYQNFVKLGLFNEKEGIDPKTIDEDKFLELQQETIDNAAKAQLDNFSTTLPDEGKALLNHLREGGDVSDFVNAYADPLKNVDIENTGDQEKVISEWLRVNGYSSEEIKSELEDINDLGKTKERAERYLGKYKAYKEEQVKELDETRKQQEVAAKENYAQTISKINDLIDKNDKVFDFALPKDIKAKQELKDYFTKRTVRLDNGQLVTKNYADQIKDREDLQSYIAQGILRKERYKLTGVKAAADTKAAVSLKQQLENNKKTPLIVNAKAEPEERITPATQLDWNDLFGTRK